MTVVAGAGMADGSGSQSSSVPVFFACKKKVVSRFPSASGVEGGLANG